MTVYIRELIDIPERVHEGDFVLNLSEGVVRPEETLRLYVVTPQLTHCFDEALGFVKSAVDTRTSKAAYLHGSFGAGKSHFMAVLHLLLQHHPRARAIPELHSVLANHTWAEGKRFLLVPYHLIGARSMESALLGGYVDYVRQVHPEAPIPAVYPATELFENARKIRAQLGENRFFEELNKVAQHAGQASGRWGKREGGWTPERFERAAGQAPLSEQVVRKQAEGVGLSEAEQAHAARAQARNRLLGHLITVFFPAYQGIASVKNESYIPLDQGLSIISQHARDLGYDALVLFLDELVLWLASRAADVSFVHREGQKLAKLVESQRPDRPIPIVSLVARQRDLRELVGDRLTGSEQVNFSDALRHWEGRFHTITLEDRNLAIIAEKRVLRPKSEAARQVLVSAFERTLLERQEVLDTLCTSSGDRTMFRQVYPFTPAMVQTLVALSSALQRHRTALKLMLLLLVEQRETLELGQIIPVGDLWDVLDARERALTEVLERSFKKARDLYQNKLRPVIKQENQIYDDEARYETSEDQALRYQWRCFRNDERLAKTLLLAALVPEVEALKELTAARLAALNHGSVVSPVEGREAQQVLSKVRSWASQVGELRLGPGNNPVLSVKLTGVDTEGLLDRVREQDNPGNRQRKVRELLFSELEIEDSDQLLFERRLIWRGTTRAFDVVYTNVRTSSLSSLQNRAGRWKLILDFPFDEPGYSPAFDTAKLDEFKQAHPEGTLTIAWLPRFLSIKAQKDLGNLVLLDYLLKGDNFERNSSHLAPTERSEARALIANQRSALHARVLQHLEAAYGIGTPRGEALDTSFDLEQSFFSLSKLLVPRTPGVGSLKDALEGVMDQALTAQLPGHPKFAAEVKIGSLKKTLEVVRQAARAKQQRVPVERPLRKTVEAIAHPLKLGEMAETHFVLHTTWRDLLNRKCDEANRAVPSVGQVRAWLDPEQEPTGLTPEVANLIILTWAEQTNRLFYLHGGPVTPTLERIDDDVLVRAQAMPTQEEWEEALRRGSAIFGVPGSPLLNATNLVAWVGAIHEVIAAREEAARRLVEQLREVSRKLSLPEDAYVTWSRSGTAVQVVGLLDELSEEDEVACVEALAGYRLTRTPEVLARSLKQSAEVVESLTRTHWNVVVAAGKSTDGSLKAGEMLLDDVVGYLESDELVQPLAPRLAEVETRALKLIDEARQAKEAGEQARREAERKAREAQARQAKEQAERERKAQEEQARLKKEQEAVEAQKRALAEQAARLAEEAARQAEEAARQAEERARLAQQEKEAERLRLEAEKAKTAAEARRLEEARQREAEEAARQEAEATREAEQAALEAEKEALEAEGEAPRQALGRLSARGERILTSPAELQTLAEGLQALFGEQPRARLKVRWTVEEE